MKLLNSLKKTLGHYRCIIVVLLCLTALFGRLLTIPLDRGDSYAFAHAARKLDAGHILDFYRREVIFTYPPGALPLCWIALYIAPSGSVFYIVYKVLVSFFDLTLALLLYNLIYKITRRFFLALASLAWVLFDPTIWFTSAVLGQLDVIYTAFLISTYLTGSSLHNYLFSRIEFISRKKRSMRNE